MTEIAPPREVDLVFPREWIEFADPADPEHLIKADLTWLCSRWGCIFGQGCAGILPGRSDDGCCSHGAFFTDKADEKRVRQAAAELDETHWQFAAIGAKRGIAERDDIDGESRLRTRVVDGACIFANRPGFAGGAGCALHALALRTDRHPLETKPDVCWQLPIRRDQQWVEQPDGESKLVSTITEFDRGAWGSGGYDLHWWCTSAPIAHRNAVPVYVSYAAELTALIGEAGYQRLAEFCEHRMKQADPLAVHPAENPQRS